MRYGELAAQRALSVYAYGEAVRHLEQALEVQEVLDPDDKAKRCDLLLALGEALLPAGEPLRALRGGRAGGAAAGRGAGRPPARVARPAGSRYAHDGLERSLLRRR